MDSAFPALLRISDGIQGILRSRDASIRLSLDRLLLFLLLLLSHDDEDDNSIRLSLDRLYVAVVVVGA